VVPELLLTANDPEEKAAGPLFSGSPPPGKPDKKTLSSHVRQKRGPQRLRKVEEGTTQS
jgi:hypothetical protein